MFTKGNRMDLVAPGFSPAASSEDAGLKAAATGYSRPKEHVLSLEEIHRYGARLRPLGRFLWPAPATGCKNGKAMSHTLVIEERYRLLLKNGIASMPFSARRRSGSPFAAATRCPREGQ